MLPEVKLEYLGEDKTIDGAKIWHVEAIHVTTTRNKRKFTLQELKESARSLSFRSLNRNHEIDRQLPFPENMTRYMKFNEQTMAVEGTVRIADSDINALIEAGKIKKVSIEQIPTEGESCNEILCEQHGVAFIGMALLDEGVVPGDEKAELKGLVHTERAQTALKNYQTISECLISNAQRECKDCTDWEACHECKHKVEANDKCMQDNINEINNKHPDWNRDQVIAVALQKCGMSDKEEAWAYYERWRPYTEAVLEKA